MIVYKVVAPDMSSDFIQAPGWRVQYAIGEIARGHVLPGRHRTPLMVYETLAQARWYVGSGRILRCFAPRVRRMTRMHIASTGPYPEAGEELDRWWSLPHQEKRRGLPAKDSCFVRHGTHTPAGVLVPWLIPIEEVK